METKLKILRGKVPLTGALAEPDSSVSPQPQPSTTRADAPQPIAEGGEPQRVSGVEAVGAPRINRRTVMNMIMGTAAMMVSGQPVYAARTGQTSTLMDLIETFKNANKALGAALKIADNIAGSKVPAVRVYGGTTEPMTLVINGEARALPASDWFFHSGDQIRKELEKSLKTAPASEHEAIEKRYAGYWSEFAKQHQTNKKATAAKRKAEAAVSKAYRVEGRAIQAILDYEPSSASDAVVLLEFAMAEEAIGDANDLRTVMENASRALRVSIQA